MIVLSKEMLYVGERIMGRRKRIAFFGNSLTSRYRRNLCRAFSIAAEEADADLVFFNSLGRIGIVNSVVGDYDTELLDYIDLDQFDGIIYDGEGYYEDGVSVKVEKKLRTARCAVVSISSHVDGFHNIDFDDAEGLRAMVEHFIDHHHFTKIAYMSGYFSHPDAQIRLSVFRSVMKNHGMPEDGAGVFEGDFWYNKGGEAADYFLSLPQRPEVIVCANDYMAMSLLNEFKKRGIRVPEDIAISGFDGTVEGQEFLPHLTSVTRERLDVARKAISLLVDLSENRNVCAHDLRVLPKPIFSQSCGCDPLDYQHVMDIISRMHEETRMSGIALFDSESAMLKLNKVDSVRALESAFAASAITFGEYRSYFMMVHTDANGCPAYDSDFTAPSGNFVPIIWIDKNREYTNSPHHFTGSSMFPVPDSDRPHIYYVMSLHCAEKIFGYAVVEMASKDIFNEYHNVLLLNVATTLHTLQKNNHIHKLVRKLEDLSIRDGLTGMLNRRGFDDSSRSLLSNMREKTSVCAMVIDMDGLKQINDAYGHYEGDRAIRALADSITACCDSGEIAGRAGGDEFYIFAPYYSETHLSRFLLRLRELVDAFNRNNSVGYNMDYSCGAYITETDCYGRIEDFLKISDSMMYAQKQSKPGRENQEPKT